MSHEILGIFEVKFKKLHPNAKIPAKATAGAAGVDLSSVETVVIPPKEVRLVPIGLAVRVPKGFEMQIRSRSGLALKESIFVLNSPGTVDSDYSGPVGVILANFGTNDFIVKPGDRIAQAVFSVVPNLWFNEVAELDETERGSGGFGSTGV